jgi:hypothetical protein
MFRRVLLIVVLALTLACGGAPSTDTDDAAWTPAPLMGETGDLPDGRDVLGRTIDFMSSHDRLAFEALATYEAVQDNGQKLQFDMLFRVAIRRPDRIYWVTLYDDASTDTAWCKDGTFTLVRQPANVWGTITVPPTLADAVSRVSDEYDIPVPFVDLLSGDVRELWLGEDVESVDYIGEAWAEGYWTDHVALRKPGVDVQVWVRQGDEPFPVKMAIVRTAEDSLPGYSARFHQWATDLPEGAIPDFTPPEGSSRVEVVPVYRP